MAEMYIMILVCVLIALFVGFAAVTMYLGWVLIQHDLDESKRKEEEADND